MTNSSEDEDMDDVDIFSRALLDLVDTNKKVKLLDELCMKFFIFIYKCGLKIICSKLSVIIHHFYATTFQEIFLHNN